MVSHYSRTLLGLCTGVTLLSGTVQGQAAVRSPQEVGQIITAALQAVVPPDRRLTSHTVAERGIRFDYARTLAAFGYPNDATARARLALGRAVTGGTDSLLVDCDQVGSKPCSRLGSSAYVYVEPISVSSSQATVWIHVLWATTPPKSKHTYLSGSSTQVILARSGSAPWTFVRTGAGVIS